MPEPTGGSTRAKQGPTATYCPDAYWAGHAYSTHVGTPVSIRRCYLFGYIDWAYLAEQVAALTADLTRERDEARTERDQLAAAVNRASSVRVDGRNVIWQPADAGRWRHPLFGGVLDLGEIEAEYGRTRPALLVPIDDEQDDEQPAGASVPGPPAQVAVACVAGKRRPAGDIRGDIPPARVLAALEVLGWPDDRAAPAHVEEDGWELTGVGHYWALVEDVLRAADQAADPVAGLDAEATARRTIAAELDQVAASDDLTDAWLERHGMGGQLAPPPPAVLRAVAADIGRGEVHGRREQFDPSIPPGGYVCAEPDRGMPSGICGMPMEDVPRTVHHPEPDAGPRARTDRAGETLQARVEATPELSDEVAPDGCWECETKPGDPHLASCRRPR